MGTKPSTQDEAVERLGEDPLLAEFLEPFPDLLTGKKRGAGASLEAMANRLSETRRSGLMQVTLNNGKTTRSWGLALTPKSCEMVEGHTDNPDLELLMQEDIWLQIASGKLPPLKAFSQGKMRVRGDVSFGRSIVRRLRRT